MRITNCRICKSNRLVKFLDLGMHPPSDAFLRKEQIQAVGVLGSREEPIYPLDVYFCQDCFLIQLGYIVPPELMFNKEYVYVTSVSKTMDAHFGVLAVDAMEKFGYKGCLVVEMGSNDGTMLKHFKAAGANVLGVDPSRAAELAVKDFIDTINDFFSEKIAAQILQEKGKARIIAGANVFAHINDLDDVIKGVYNLLEDDGVLIPEFPYLLDLVNHLEFDTMYHEHLSYLAIKPLTTLFKRFDMEVFDLKRTPVHGGSIRVFVKKAKGKWETKPIVEEVLDLEKNSGLYSLETYKKFAENVKAYKEEFTSLLKKLKAEGKKIAGNGAAAKGNTLLNYCKIGPDIMDYIVDPNPIKHYTFTPGMHIPVLPLSKVVEDKPDYMVILPWNFKDVIMKQEERIRQWGGKFIIPLPKPTIA